MALVRMENITKSFGVYEILNGVTADIFPQSRIGLVGANGSGKTTLIRIILSDMEADVGQVIRQKNLKIAYLPQTPNLDETKNVFEQALQSKQELLHIEKQLQIVEKKLANVDDNQAETLVEQQAHLWEAFENVGGYRHRSDTEIVLQRLGFEESQYSLPVSALSGGQKSRLALAQVLLAQYDLIIFDEPTNFLDLACIEWLESYLRDVTAPMLIISHDRYFLNNVVNEIWELGRGKLQCYRGNYDAYCKIKHAQQQQQQQLYQRQQEEIRRQQDFIRRNIVGQKHRQAQSRRKMLEKMDQIEAPVQEQKMSPLIFEVGKSKFNKVIEVRNLGHTFINQVDENSQKELDRALFHDLSFSLCGEEKLGIIGPNGCGKSTLLHLLAQHFPPTEGMVNLGAKVKLGFYHQELQDLVATETVFSTIKQLAPTTDDKPLRDFLARFMFRDEDIYKQVLSLSGGEKGRLALARLLLQKPNLLMLDEPTNHLDITSRQALEESLQDYPGTLLFVSHDRYFIDQVATRLLIFHDNSWINFHGNYSQFHNSKEQIIPQKPAKTLPKKSSAPPPSRQRRRPKKKRYTLEELEQKIIHAETRLQEITEELATEKCYQDPQQVKQLNQEYQQLTEQLADWNLEWENWI